MIIPSIGGGLGGKSAIMLEILVSLTSKSVEGRVVHPVIIREQDTTAPPSRIRLEVNITIGANKDEEIQVA